MNLRLFFARPKQHLICMSFIFLCITACARKNKHLYNFSELKSLCVSRLALPYVSCFSVFYDKKLKRYHLDWSALGVKDLPVGVSFIGYNIYQNTQLGFSPRRPQIQIPSGIHTCIIQGEFSQNQQQFFAIEPTFIDSLDRELIGIQTIAIAKN